MDALDVLRRDHRRIDQVLRSLMAAGEKDTRKRKKLKKELVEELAMHQNLEEQVLYPTAEKEAKDLKPAVIKAQETHAILKGLMQDLDGMQPQEEPFGAKVEILADLVRAHFQEEDDSVLVPLSKALTEDQLKELGTRIEEGRAALKNPKDYLKLD